MSKKIAYCTGFWCTNIGNSFFSLGVEYALKRMLGEENVSLVSDIQTYTTSYGKRLFPHKNQFEYLSRLEVDYIVLAGPMISKYFLKIWKDILIKLEKRGVRYILLSAGMMKMNASALSECKDFFSSHPPYVLCSREKSTYDEFGKYADHSYNGICFSFFAPDYYHPAKFDEKYFTLNFDKICEPDIKIHEKDEPVTFAFNNKNYIVRNTSILTRLAYKTDRFSDALAYIASIFPQKKRPDAVGEYSIIRTDHRFHPHFRSKIYNQSNSFCADLPYGYLNIYANSSLTLSDRVHACAVTLAFGNEAMLFTKTNRVGLLERVGAGDIVSKPVRMDLIKLENEKQQMLDWISQYIS